MRLKRSGPDYKAKDLVKSLADFKERVKAYESAYEPLGQYEEDNDLQYIQVRCPSIQHQLPRELLTLKIDHWCWP
jgi:hypothetical protein